MKKNKTNSIHNNYRKKRGAALLVLVLVVSSLGGCKSPVSTSGDDETITEGVSLSIAVSSNTLTANPFLVSEDSDTSLLQLTQAKLLTTDREGNIVYDAAKGATIPYNGTDYSYEGPASVTAAYDKSKKQTTYTIALRDDLTCSDGSVLCADDLLFTYYVLCDNSYTGGSKVSSVPIVGLDAYLCGTKQVKKFKEDVQAELKKPSENTKKLIQKQIIQKQLKQQYKWVMSLYDDENYSSYTQKYEDPKELFAYFFNLTDGYNAADAEDKNQLINDIAAQYDGDYKKLADSCGLDFTKEANDIARSVIMEKQGKNQVSSISGIKKIDNNTITIMVKGQKEKDLYNLCNIYIAPLSQYGDADLYDYDKSLFGFTKDDVSSVLEKDILPAGGGAYALTESDGTTYLLQSNKNYYKGNPKSTNLKLLRLDNADMAQVIDSGAADFAICDLTKNLYDDVMQANTDKTTTCLLTSPKEGYVYLGINAQEVFLGNDTESAQSIAFRKAFLTVFSSYKADSIKEYYGDSVLPLKTEYDMDADSALEEAVALLQEAGLSYDDSVQKFTTSPLSPTTGLPYTISVVGFEIKDHPIYQMLTDTQEALASVGIELQIIDEPDVNTLWKHVYDKTSQMWIYNYSSSSANTEDNAYGLKDSSKKSINSACVELQLFQKQTAILSSPATSIASDKTAAFTSFYTLFDMIESIETESE